MTYTIPYPRKAVLRNSLRYTARSLFPLLSKTHMTGLEKFPKEGPLIVVGNHTGAMEVVMMGVFSPRIIEFMGAMEMPWNGFTGFFVELYGLIPVYRGYPSLKTMKMGVDVLKQKGMLGLFPEGGFWEPGVQKAQSGAAWLSYKAQAPILPIGFGDTRGKMADMFRLKRPYFEMHVGDVLPPVQLSGIVSKKEELQQAADKIMDAVWALVPEEEKQRKHVRPEEEQFFFEVNVLDATGQPVDIPANFALTEGAWVSRFAHRPNLIDSIRDYIFIPVQVFKELDRRPPAEELYQAAHAMIDYVENDNPQYFNYRYGYEDGAAFKIGFEQLRALMQWVMDQRYMYVAEARYEYKDPKTGEDVVLTRPIEIEQW